MTSTERAGRVGRPHGLDGSFHLDASGEPLEVGISVRVGERVTAVERLAGTAAHPIVRVAGVASREAAAALRGEHIYVERVEAELDPGEYLAADLVGLRVADLGSVRRVINAPSCDLLEVGEGGLLVPFVRDAVRRVDLEAGTIEVDRGFLGLA
jgi:16S rRNA processing protein RimM